MDKRDGGDAKQKKRACFYVICMTKHAERLASASAIKTTLESAAFSVTIIDAVDGSKLDAAVLDKLSRDGIVSAPNDDDGQVHDMYDRPMRNSQFGCALSHMTAIRLIRDRQEEDYAVVFEDDVELVGDFEAKLDFMIKGMDAYPNDIDMINLYMWPHDKLKLRVSERKVGDVIRMPMFGYFGTQCIMYRKSSASKIMCRILPIRNPIDDHFATVGLKYFTVCNIDFVTHGKHDSSVGTTASTTNSNAHETLPASNSNNNVLPVSNSNNNALPVSNNKIKRIL
jgi:GR25 family glycosyltransferase involved in LPS biosynthesis